MGVIGALEDAMTLNRLKRYKDIALFLMKNGAVKALRENQPGQNLPEEAETQPAEMNGDPSSFARGLEEMGPTFIKLGQLLSTRPEFLPQPYLDALARLQDNVKPFRADQVEEIVATELGVRLSKAFQEFDLEPIAAASLGQVHKARLRDGRLVAVKVQRPDIRETIREDLDALESIASSIDRHTEVGRKADFQEMLKEFRKTLFAELDYRLEAQNMVKLSTILEKYERIIVPQPVDDYTTSRVLTMEYVRGTKITSFSPLARLEMDGKALAEDLFKAYLDQVLVEGFFHADPHPGNVFLTDDRRIALIDLGMVARVDPEIRESLLKLLLEISEGRGREAAAVSMKIGTVTDDFDEQRFTREASEFVGRYHDATLDQIKVGRVMMELTRIAAQNGLHLLPELTMLGKTLLNLDEVGRTMEPQFDPNAVIREHANSIMQQQLLRNLSPNKLFSSILEMNEFVRKLPVRLNRVLDRIADNDFRIQAFDDIRIMESLQKVANRIAVGLVLASLIIGAAMLMRVESGFKIFGYPGLAMLMFIVAAGLGFGLVFNIMIRDSWPRKPRRRI
jgi:ubiquinone biosynthesis protein